MDRQAEARDTARQHAGRALQVYQDEDGMVTDRRLLPEVPPTAAVPADPVHALRARHESQGLRIHAGTAIPDWFGEHLDVGYAIDVLHPLAAAVQAAVTFPS